MVSINNDLNNDTYWSEYIGLSNFRKRFSLVRNLTAHEPKIKFFITEGNQLGVNQEVYLLLIVIMLVMKMVILNWLIFVVD